MRGWWLLLLAVAIARPHRPGGEITEAKIHDPTISWVLYGTFERGAEWFVLELDMPTDFALPFELLIEKRPALRDHRPMYAVVGPGLPPPTIQQAALLPGELPEGWGLFLETNDRPDRAVYFEQVMRRTYWTSGTIALPLQAGVNEVWVFNPDGTTGPFQLGFGIEEDFSDGAMGAIFSDWGNYAY